MQEQSEIINLILSIILFTYYLYLLKGFELKVPNYWIYAMMCIILSNVSTIIEGYFYYNLFDYVEHGLYMVSGLLFFIGTFRLKTF